VCGLIPDPVLHWPFYRLAADQIEVPGQHKTAWIHAGKREPTSNASHSFLSA